MSRPCTVVQVYHSAIVWRSRSLTLTNSSLLSSRRCSSLTSVLTNCSVRSSDCTSTNPTCSSSCHTVASTMTNKVNYILTFKNSVIRENHTNSNRLATTHLRFANRLARWKMEIHLYSYLSNSIDRYNKQIKSMKKHIFEQVTLQTETNI